MNTQSTISRLKTIAQLKVVAGAAEFGALVDSIQAGPAAFVVEASFDPDDNLIAGGVLQSAQTTINVLIAVNTSRDSTGQASNQDLDTIRSLIRSKLLGWSPETGATGYEAAPGRLLSFRPGLVWWSDSYRTIHTIGTP